MKSPFKFLDSYTKDDRNIFFGREREIEELYHRVFESKIMLVYGVSGTGKSSLIHCGLANKFSETDWLPLVIRRGGNILESMATSIKAVAITNQPGEVVTPAQFRKVTRSLYLDHYKPIFFIFDQFEELFIFGSKEEKKGAVQVFKTLVESDIQCRLIFVMREEYMAGITEFEKFIPTIFQNRVRIEKMSHVNAIEAIEGPCKVAGITLEKGFAEALLEKLSPESGDVELTYLQVFLDRILRILKTEYEKISFTNSLLSNFGNVSDILGSFLDEQISLLPDPQTGLSILKSFVSLKGTRKQLNEEEIAGASGTFGMDVPRNVLKEYLLHFVNLRILKEKNEAEQYELRHDSLAEKIFGKISLLEKELLEVMNFIETAYVQFEKRSTFLSEEDLKYVMFFEDKQILKKNQRLIEFIEASKKYHNRKKRKQRQLITSVVIVLIVVLSALSVWAISQRGKAITQKEIAEEQKNEAIKAKQEAQAANQIAEIQRIMADSSTKIAIDQKYKADNARKIAEDELYRKIKNTLTVSAEAMNVLYRGISNPIMITVSGIPSDKLEATINNGSIRKGVVYKASGEQFSGDYLVSPGDAETVEITVYGETKYSKKDLIGRKVFRVKDMPRPSALFCFRYGGIISKNEALAQEAVFVNLSFDFDIRFTVVSFVLTVKQDSINNYYRSNSMRITDEQRKVLKELKSGNYFTIDSIMVLGPDQHKRQIESLLFKID